MKINIGNSTKSIEKAIRQVEAYQKEIKTLMPNFLKRCAQRVIELANVSLEQRAGDIDNSVLTVIRGGWKIEPSADKKSVMLINDSGKATYIEFGVGQVGAENQPTLASQVGYDYNRPTRYKKYDEKSGKTVWWFKADGQSVDIADKYRLQKSKTTGMIKTAGQPATLFLFNAFRDFVEREAYVPIWQELIKGL